MNRHVSTLISLVTMIAVVACCCVGPGGLRLPPDPGRLPTIEATGAAAAPTQGPFERVEIVSQKEMTAEEILKELKDDERFQDLVVLASEEGYTDPLGGGRFTASDGKVAIGLVIASIAEEKVVTAVQLTDRDRTHSLLARVDDASETLILYDRDGRAEISGQGIKVFDGAGNPIGGPTPSGSRSRPGLAAPVRQCENPNPHAASWADFDHCGRSYSGAAWGQISGCVSTSIGAVLGFAFASTAAAPWVLAGGVIAVIVGCRVPAICVYRARRDDPPTYDVRLPEKLPEPCRVECGVAQGEEAMLTIDKYRIQVHVDDDRPPRPASPQSVELCAGETQILRIRDCAGHQIDLPIEAPPPEDYFVCGQGETCVQEGNNARCVAEAKPTATQTETAVEPTSTTTSAEVPTEEPTAKPTSPPKSTAKPTEEAAGGGELWKATSCRQITYIWGEMKTLEEEVTLTVTGDESPQQFTFYAYWRGQATDFEEWIMEDTFTGGGTIHRGLVLAGNTHYKHIDHAWETACGENDLALAGYIETNAKAYLTYVEHDEFALESWVNGDLAYLRQSPKGDGVYHWECDLAPID
jgi:hypothetical protein